MKSRWTTYLLSAVVVVVWGLVVKRIFFDTQERTVTVVCDRIPERTIPTYETDTLRCDYADPFRIGRTKTAGRKPKTVKKTVRPTKKKRDRVTMRYFGSVRSDKRILHIVDVNNDRYELSVGECADSYMLKYADSDSLYFEKDEITYSLSRTI